MELLIGCDPEFFVKKDGKLVSAYGLIEGTKENPLKVKGGAVQVDGMALEFNIDPASTFNQFNDNINMVLGELRKMVPEEYEFVFDPVAEFGKEYIDAQPEVAKRLGCDPDFNAYTGEANHAPDASVSFRTASGHIHLGWTSDQDINNPEHIEACQMLVKQLDAMLGLATIIFDRDTTRRTLYGKAGAYRPKPYGVEYRTPSNAWLQNKSRKKLVFDLATAAFTNLIEGRNYATTKARDLINSDDWSNAYGRLSCVYRCPTWIREAFNALNASNMQDIYKKVAWDLETVSHLRDEVINVMLEA